MHSTTLLVLSTLAIGQAAAGAIRHAGFHARRHAEPKPDDDGLLKTDWKNVVKSVDDYVDYDAAIKAANVDFKTVSVDWNTVFHSSAAPAPAASTPAPEPPKAEVKVEAPKAEEPKSEYKAASSSAAATSASQPAASSSAPVADTKQKSSAIGAFVDGLVDDIDSWTDLIKNDGVNSKSSDQPIWLGDDGKFTATFKNDANKDIMLVCWSDAAGTYGFIMTGADVNTKPLVKVKIPQGKAQKVSFGSVSGGCAPAYKGLSPSNSGGIHETWLEFTFGGQFPTYDISRLPNMNGMSISATAKSNGCVSDMETCVFKCKNGMEFCMAGPDVELVGTGKNSECNAAQDALGAWQGGCRVDAGGDHVDISIS